MEEIRFDILHPDTRREQIVVSASRAAIGTGAHCDVRVAVDQATFEHVVVELQAGAMRVQNLSPMLPATLDGAPFQVVNVEHGAMLVLGATRIQITRSAIADKAKRKMGVGTVVRALALVAVPLALYAAGKRQKAATEVADEVPQIFATAAPPCPRADPEEARAYADDQQMLADAARERSPFEPRAALSAVTAYETAHSCYRVAGAVDEAGEAVALADDLRASTLVDLRMRQLRLRRALRTDDWEVAARDVTVLRSLTEEVPSDYGNWLADTQRELQTKNGHNKR